MRRSERTSGGSKEQAATTALFDLPLVLSPSVPEQAASPPESEKTPSTDTHLDSELLPDSESVDALDAAPREAKVTERSGPTGRPPVAAGLLRRRLLAGLIDLAATTAAWTILLLSALFLGAGLRASDWPGYLLALASFSFVYTVYSLVFWGRTPGMRRARLAAHSDNGEPMTVGQAILRWLGAAITTLLLGLPSLLLIRSGRSLADYVSDSSLGS